MNPIDKLIDAFERFPGIGPRQARRFVQYLLSAPSSVRAEIAENIRSLSATTSQCKRCYRWFPVRARGAQGASVCDICENTNRIASILFVIEKDADIDNIERSGFRGLYFVLGGTIPLAAEEPQKYIRLRELVKRVEEDAIKIENPKSDAPNKLEEVILGLSATTEGDHTRLILQEKLRPVSEGFNLKLSSLGRGLSTGSELEYADPDTIANALNSRN